MIGSGRFFATHAQSGTRVDEVAPAIYRIGRELILKLSKVVDDGHAVAR